MQHYIFNFFKSISLKPAYFILVGFLRMDFSLAHLQQQVLGVGQCMTEQEAKLWNIKVIDGQVLLAINAWKLY